MDASGGSSGDGQDRADGPLVLTVGHSTREIADFLAILRAHDVARVVDVRAYPRSRRNPQFDGGALAKALGEVGIAYTHLPGLGGRRRLAPDSPASPWRSASFRAFADYMRTPEFAASLDVLAASARRERVVIACAEAVPWRCHRSLIADALLARGFAVEHILGAGPTRPHFLPPFARIRGSTVDYVAPAEAGSRQPTGDDHRPEDCRRSADERADDRH